MTMPRSPDLYDLAHQFFEAFARAEYALKAAGFHAGKGKKAEPNWDAFAKSLNSLFEQQHEGELGEAVRFLLEQPPRVQTVNTAGDLEWVEAPEAGPVSRRLLLYVRRVRNNLFHGSKFNGRWFDPERSEPLMRHSLTILRACVEASTDVKKAYDH
jgi:hypothetical protein